MTHGQRDSGAALGNHGARALARHQAGNDGPTDRACDGLSVSPAREGPTRQTRLSVSFSQEGCVRSWLFMTQAYWVRAGSAAEVATGLLATQTRSEPTARYEKRARASGYGLECANDLGMRAERSHPDQNKNKGVS